MNAILSIKPIYANDILKGEKTVEFRKQIFEIDRVKKVYIYSSSPVMKIVGYFIVEDIIKTTPNQLWLKYGSQGGSISKKKLLEYFEGKEFGFALKIQRVHKFKTPKDPKKRISNFVAPQNYRYTKVKL